MQQGEQFYEPSEREKEIVKALSSFGHSHAEIADYLDLAPKSLAKHYGPELKKGKVELSLTCGSYLVQVVKDESAATKYRLSAACFILARLFKQQWSEKIDPEKSDDTAKAIRDGVEQIASALIKPDKEVGKKDAGTSV